jgi:hypothetical protein
MNNLIEAMRAMLPHYPVPVSPHVKVLGDTVAAFDALTPDEQRDPLVVGKLVLGHRPAACVLLLDVR